MGMIERADANSIPSVMYRHRLVIPLVEKDRTLLFT